MIGASLPVAAVSYPALPELIKSGYNGITFKSSTELEAQLFRLFCYFPVQPSTVELNKMSRAAKENMTTWELNWDSTMLPVVHGIVYLS
jgi:hypothetical protein